MRPTSVQMGINIILEGEKVICMRMTCNCVRHVIVFDRGHAIACGWHVCNWVDGQATHVADVCAT